MPTIETSSPSRNSAPHSTTSAPQVRADQRSAATSIGEVMPETLHACASNVYALNAAAFDAWECGNLPAMAATTTDVVAEWRALAARHAAVFCALERELHSYGLGVSDFEVLDRLAEDKDDSHRV